MQRPIRKWALLIYSKAGRSASMAKPDLIQDKLGKAYNIRAELYIFILTDYTDQAPG